MDKVLQWADEMGVSDEVIDWLTNSSFGELVKALKGQEQEYKEFLEWIDTL